MYFLFFDKWIFISSFVINKGRSSQLFSFFALLIRECQYIEYSKAT